jgi:hypothetical protein
MGFRIACLPKEVSIFRTSSFVFEQRYCFRQRLKEVILTIPTAIGERSALQRTATRTGDCIFRSSRDSRWRTISGSEDAFLELNLWIRSYKNEKEKCRLFADEDLNSRSVQLRTIQTNRTDPSICGAQTIHVVFFSFWLSYSTDEFQGLVRVIFADFVVKSALISALSVRGHLLFFLALILSR